MKIIDILKVNNLQELQNIITGILMGTNRTAEEILIEDGDGYPVVVQVIEETLTDGSTVVNVRIS
jgi:hypothetical protein